MKIKEYIKPMDLGEAYENLISQKNSCLLAGGAFLRLQHRTLPIAIDLSDLGLKKITVTEDSIEIGAMTTLHMIETHSALPTCLRDGTKQIAGVAVRNLATIGGSIMGRYPWSDVATALVALGAELNFYKGGKKPIETFIHEGLVNQDILVSISIPKVKNSCFSAYKPVYTDFSLVNLSIALTNHFVISIGASPKRAVSIYLDQLDDIDTILSQFEFASDLRASGEYRKALASSLLEDAMKEAKTWK